jgi:hypothetical protein
MIRWRDVRRAALLLSAASSLSGCFVPEGRHTMRFELAKEPVGAVVNENKSYFFWGLVPTVRVDVLDKCPYGATAIVDGAPGGRIWFPTLGLWSRRSTTYYCRQPRAMEQTS